MSVVVRIFFSLPEAAGSGLCQFWEMIEALCKGKCARKDPQGLVNSGLERVVVPRHPFERFVVSASEGSGGGVQGLGELSDRAPFLDQGLA